MVEMLVDELSAIGLALNASKTKILTTEPLSTPLYIDMADGFVEVLVNEAVRKYLGRRFPGNLARRGQVEFANRLACAWGKFHKHRQWLMNKHISMHRRLKLFQLKRGPNLFY